MKKRNHLQKRGQITVFIIIGVIVLFSTATILYIRGQITEQKISTEKEPVIREVPGQLKVVSQFVEACIKEKAIEGLAGLGEHGGYIDLDSSYLQQNNIVFKQQIFQPTDSDYVELFEGSDVKIPYWYYLKSKNKAVNACDYASNKPKLWKNKPVKAPYYAEKENILRNANNLKKADATSIEAQLENYIATEIPGCIGDFAQLKERGYDVEKAGEIKAQVTVADQDVRFLVQLPLKINYQGSATELNEFYIKIPLELKKVYEIAQSLVDAQINYNFMSRITRSLIGSYVGMDDNKLMPLAETEYGGTPMFWTKTDMKKTFEDILSRNTQFWQVQGSKNFDLAKVNATQRYSASIKRTYDNMILEEQGLRGVSDYKDFGIYFEYLGWPIYFNVNCKGELCRAQQIKSVIPTPASLTVNRYNAQYDISYPVVVQIVHPPTLEFNSGYVFRFAMEDNVRTNKELVCGQQAIEIPSGNAEETLLCDPIQRRSGDITITVTDSVSGKPVDGANIDLDFAGIPCNLGTTDKKGIFKGKLPLGYGALITAQKFGNLTQYITQSKSMDIFQDKSEDIVIELVPVREVDVEFKKIKLDANTLQPLDSINPAAPLSKENAVSLIFTMVSKNTLEEEFSTIMYYDANSSEKPVIRLAPGEYDVTGTLLENNIRIIPPSVEIIKRGWWQSSKKEPLPSKIMKNPHPWGGLELRLRIDENTLRRDKIKLTVIEFPDARSIKDMAWSGQLAEMSQANKALLMPR